MLRALDGTVRKATDMHAATQSKSVREKTQTDIKIPVTLTPGQQHSFECDFSLATGLQKSNTMFTMFSFVSEVFG